MMPREALHVDPQEAPDTQAEIGTLAARLRANDPTMRWIAEYEPVMVGYESGARAGLAAYRPAVEALKVIHALVSDERDINFDPGLASIAKDALEAARG